jgi:hypothetical protein
MLKKLKWIVGVAVVVFALLQLTNPARINPPVVRDMMADNPAPPEVAAMLRSACYDCHSDETRWPFYSHIAPVSWTVASDVREGRQHVNLSEWPQDPKAAAKKFEHMSDEVDDGGMPLAKYTLIHRDARLTDAQKKQLVQWLDSRATAMKAEATNQ